MGSGILKPGTHAMISMLPAPFIQATTQSCLAATSFCTHKAWTSLA